jgi:two-component sensor histidine kinase/PAS domain-containing protein
MVQPIGLQVLTPRLIGVAYLLTSIGLLLLLRQPLSHLDKPGSKGFLLAVVAISLWPLSVGANAFIADLSASIAVYNVRLLAAALVSVGWFLLAFEFTTQRIPSRPVLGALAGYVLGGQLLAWTNPTHLLVLGPGTAVRNGVLLPEYGPWFWVQAAINYGLILGASGLLATDWLHSRGLRRHQSALLALAVAPPIAANLLTIFGLVETTYDLTPFGLIGSGLILSWTLYRLEFLNVVPVGRDIAVGVMEDGVVIVDDSDRVIDCNGSATRLFAIEAGYYGDPVEDVLDRLPRGVLDRLTGTAPPDGSADATLPSEVSFEVDGRQRHFSLTRSAVRGTGETDLGQVLVFRDITALKDREADLELLRQVLTRILRHNLRTNLNVISGYAELLRADYDDDRIDRITEASRSLGEISEKATHLEEIIQPETAAVTYDLAAVVADAVDAVRKEYPSVTVIADTPDSCRVRSALGLPVVVDNLVENAAEHNDAAEPRIHVAVDSGTDGPVLRVSDNGPSIPDHELTVLETREETPLHHGSGLGLWIVRWWADRSDVSLAFETGADGTAVSLTFPESAVVDAD